jgi:hypothetical protein
MILFVMIVLDLSQDYHDQISMLRNPLFCRPLLNRLPAKSVLAGTKLVLFGRYVLKFYVGIVQ